MSANRVTVLARGLRELRRAPDISVLRAARSPQDLARLALIPAGRNLGIAVGLLPQPLRSEATAALLACRVLDAYEDLHSEPLAASRAVDRAAKYLTGSSTAAPPPVLHVNPARDSEAVDLVLAERIADIRALILALPKPARSRLTDMLADVAATMAANLRKPMPRQAYGEGVLGRVVRYACSVLTPDTTDDEIGDLAGCVGAATQLANDLRDGELQLYAVDSDDELIRTVMLRLLTPALGSFALLSRVGPDIPSRGARTAMAYMAITTTAFFCVAVDAPGPYRRHLRMAAAIAAASSSRQWSAMLHRTRRSVDSAVHQFLDASPALAAEPDDVFALGNLTATTPGVGPLAIESAFALIQRLPEEPLIGALPGSGVRDMMIADHFAFGAVERLHPGDGAAMHHLGAQFRAAALSNSTVES